MSLNQNDDSGTAQMKASHPRDQRGHLGIPAVSTHPLGARTMTPGFKPGSGTSMTPPPQTLPPSWQRLLALSGVAFAVLLLFGWFLSGGDAPDYTATDKAWTDWAEANRLRSGIGGFLILLAGFALLHFAGTIRSVLDRFASTVASSAQLARVASAGAVVGAAGIAMAIVMVAAATVREPTRIRS